MILNNIKVLLIMLDSSAPSPCLNFDTDSLKSIQLSECAFTKVMKGLLKYGACPDILCSVGGKQTIDSRILQVAQELGDRFLISSTSTTKEFGNYHKECFVINNLNTLAQGYKLEGEGSYIINFYKNEIKDLYNVIVSNLKNFHGTLSLQPTNVYLYKEDDFLLLEKQLCLLGQLMLQLNSAGYTLRIRNIFPENKNSIQYCGAGVDVITLGPDGYFYKCPAYYHAGKEFSIGSIEDMEHGRISTDCSRFCDTKGAPCPFLENDKISTYRGGLAKRYSEMYVSVMQKLMLKACNKIYYFNGLLSIRSSEAKIRSRVDGGVMYSTEWQKNDLVIDDLITAIKTIHEAIRDKDTQKEKFKKEFSCIDGGEYEPRRNIFVKRMHNILDGIYEIKSYSKQCHSNISIIKKSSLLKNTKEKCDTVRLLSSDDFAKIEQLYAHQVGWSFFFNDISNDIKSGFYISEETKTYIINKLKNARESVQKWFQMIIKRDRWQNSNGYWKIDFDSKAAIFVEQRNSNHIMNKMGFSEKTQVPDGNSFAIPDDNGFSMILGDRDFEIAFSIHETVGALLDMVRYKIRKVVEGIGSEEELSECIYELGRNAQLRDKWYDEMSKIYNWPRGILLGISEVAHSVSANILPRTKMSKNEWEAIHGR